MHSKYKKLIVSVLCLGISISVLGKKSDFVKLEQIHLSNKRLEYSNRRQEDKPLSPENKALFESTARKTYATLGYEINNMEKFTIGYQFLMERPLNDENIGRFIENLNVVAKLTKPTPDNKNFINSFVEAAQDNKFTEIELSNLDKIIENNTDGAVFASSPSIRLVNSLKSKGASEYLISEATKILDSGIKFIPQVEVSIGLQIGDVMNIYVASSLKIKTIK